jgi:hypothetical protein
MKCILHHGKVAKIMETLRTFVAYIERTLVVSTEFSPYVSLHSAVLSASLTMYIYIYIYIFVKLQLGFNPVAVVQQYNKQVTHKQSTNTIQKYNNK